MRSKLVSVLIMAGVFGSTSVLAEQNWYAGGSLGQSKVAIDDNALAVTGQTAASLSKNDTDTTYKFFGGYQFNKHLAVEGGYADFGKFSAQNNVTAPSVGSASAHGKVSGWFVGAVGSLPLNEQFAVLGKLGTVYSTVKMDLSTSGAVTLVGAASREHSEFNLSYGLGMQYSISKTVALRAEWERFEGLGNTGCASCTGASDVDLLSLGLSFKF